MKELVRLEFQKILKSKLSIISILALAVVIIFMIAAALSSVSSYSESGESIRGFEAIKREQVLQKEVEGPVTPESIADVIALYQKIGSDPANLNDHNSIRDDVYINNLYKYQFYFNAIATVYAPSGETVDYAVIDSLTYEDGLNFYNVRSDKIKGILDMDYTYGNYSEAEKARIMAMDSELNTPFTYSYKTGWQNILQNMFMFFVAVSFVMCICVAPTFSNEFQTGAASIILSSRNGKTKVFYAKIIAGMLFSTLLFFTALLVFTSAFLVIFGAGGYSSNFQVLSFTSVYNITILEGYLIAALVAYLAFMAIVALTLLVSVAFKNNFAVIILAATMLFVPLFIPNSRTIRFFNYAINLLPSKALNGFDTLCSSFSLYGFGKILVPQPFVMVVFSAIVITLALAVSKEIYKRLQVHN